MGAARRQELPPLEPNAYLAWRWRSEGSRAAPMTVPEWAILTGVSVRQAHRDLVGMAAFSRRLVRLRALGYDTEPMRLVGHRLLLEWIAEEVAF